MDYQVFNHNWRLAYSSQHVQYALGQMTHAIVRLSNPKHPLVLISLLKGGVWTGYNLLHQITDMFLGRFKDIRIGHMGLSSYGNNKVPEDVKIIYTLDLDISDLEGADIWIIDDIWDTGKTMKTAYDRVRRMGGADLRTCVLVYRRKAAIQDPPNGPHVYGFLHEGDEFFVGCGMGIGEQYRYLPELYVEKNRLY